MISHVAIIGGGMTGPTLALSLLRDHGVRSTIYEREDDPGRTGGSMSLAPNALRVLDRVGRVYHDHNGGDGLKGRGFEHDGIEVLDSTGKKRLGGLVVGSELRWGYRALRVWRADVRRALLMEAKAEGIEVRFGMRCVAVLEEEEEGNGGTTTVAFENGERVAADLVVGCDGINSVVRRHLDPSVRSTFSGQVAIIAFAKRQEDPVRVEEKKESTARPESCFIIGEAGTFAMLPCSSTDDLMFFATLEFEDRTLEAWRAFEADKVALASMMRDRFDKDLYPTRVRDLVRETAPEAYTSWPFREIANLEGWVSESGRVVVCGDAAHAIPPSVAQAGAMSLEDAETLAAGIARINVAASESSDAPAGKDILGKWEDHRRQRVRRVAELTRVGSELRKGMVSGGEVGKEVLLTDMERGLDWLYGYDGKRVVEKALDGPPRRAYK